MDSPRRPADTRIWITESSRGKTLLFAMLAVVSGGIFAVVGWHLLDVPYDQRDTDAWVLIVFGLLGAVMAVAGVWVLVAQPRQSITVDPVRKHIVIDSESRFSRQSSTIRFSEIQRLQVEQQGDDEGGTASYSVRVSLLDGRTQQLFASTYEGAQNEHAQRQRMQRLADIIITAYPSKRDTLVEATPRQRIVDWLRTKRGR